MRTFGRIRSRDTRRALPFARYLAQAEIDAAPPARDWIGGRTDFPLFGNDQVGDCTIASLYDRLTLIGRLDPLALQQPGIGTLDAASALLDYTAIGGYDGTPGDATDHGLQPINVLQHAQNVGIAGLKIPLFVRLNFDNGDEMRAACNLLGPLYVGAGLPKALDGQGYDWEMPPIAQRTDVDAPDPDRGHMFLLGGYDRSGWKVVTWGSGLYRASNAWAEECIDEAYALLDDAWATSSRAAPNGFDFARLRADFASL